MLVLLKEEKDGQIKDIVINPSHVTSIESYHIKYGDQTPKSKVSLIDGKNHIIIGEVLAVTNKLSGKKRLLNGWISD